MHWNTRYGSIERCYDKPNGIAILSYPMQVRIRVTINAINSYGTSVPIGRWMPWNP